VTAQVWIRLERRGRRRARTRSSPCFSARARRSGTHSRRVHPAEIRRGATRGSTPALRLHERGHAGGFHGIRLGARAPGRRPPLSTRCVATRQPAAPLVVGHRRAHGCPESTGHSSAPPGRLKRAQRDGSAVAVLSLDLDHFKQVNDLFGHAAGDRALRRVGRCLRRMARATDSVGRVGGEEFLVVLPATRAGEAPVSRSGCGRRSASRRTTPTRRPSP
jgi:hypothetical protein